MAYGEARCPTHRGHPAEDCAMCEQMIAEVEYERDHGGADNDYDHRTGSDRYEAWLDRCFEG